MWLDHLPGSVAFCDVETTGVGQHARIISFGGIGMISRNLAKQPEAMPGSDSFMFASLAEELGTGAVSDCGGS